MRLKCTKTHLRAYKGPKNFFRLAIARHEGEGKRTTEGRGGEGRGGEGRGGEGRGGRRGGYGPPPMEIPGYAAGYKPLQPWLTSTLSDGMFSGLNVNHD
jgi:hypothetical protein